MLSKRIEEKGILTKLLENGLKILLRKECNKIGELNINIVASSKQIIKGVIKKINIIARDINYKNLLFDEIELDSNEIKINFHLKNKEFTLKNNFIVNFKISLSENSLKTILLSNDWDWIGRMITIDLLNKDMIEDINIKNNQLIIKGLKYINPLNVGQKVNLKAKNGKIYLENKTDNKSITIPIEEKVYIKSINIENNYIIIFAKSSVSF